jgi:hypothetical protein
MGNQGGTEFMMGIIWHPIISGRVKIGREEKELYQI